MIIEVSHTQDEDNLWVYSFDELSVGDVVKSNDSGLWYIVAYDGRIMQNVLVGFAPRRGHGQTLWNAQQASIVTYTKLASGDTVSLTWE